MILKVLDEIGEIRRGIYKYKVVEASRMSSFGRTPESSVVNKSISFMLPDFHIAQQFVFDLIAFGMPSFP